MSQQEKSAYYQALKAAGVAFDRHYREYSIGELKEAYDRLNEENGQEPQAPPPPPVKAPRPPRLLAPIRERDPNEMAGQRQNTHTDDEPLRTDDDGLIWYQEEVQKAAFAKPRGRRVLKYVDHGYKEEHAQTGDYSETFEVSGDKQVPSEVKITLPSYQVGIFKDPRFPFKIHTYNGLQGFNLFEVQDYYGGAELVPEDVKRMYVENVLCYDIRTTVRAIETEFRQLRLAGKV